MLKNHKNENENERSMHVVVFPWLAFGHMLPHLELTKHLASNGHRVSFLSPPRNLERIRPKIPSELGTMISLVPLPLPNHPNLPPEAQCTNDLPPSKVPFLMEAYDGLHERMAEFLESSLDPPVDWIIYDFNPWIAPIADRLGIRKAFFSIVSAWSIAVVASLVLPPAELSHVQSTFPKKYEELCEAKKFVGNYNNVSESTGLTLNGCDVILIRSCLEFEAESIKVLELLFGKLVVPVGLLPPAMPDGEDTWEMISGWLGKQRKGSVVYVALGSETTPSQENLIELALGLEESQVPFFWALRIPLGSSLELPHGFEERTKERGLVWTSWAPQARILAHDSVGAFLSHCGWSSTLEAIYFAKPLVLLPFVLDQIINANDMEERKLGIKIPRNDAKDGFFTRDSVAESLQIVLQSEKGKVCRDEAQKISRIVSDEALHNQYLGKMGEYLYEHRPKRT